jgi:hypothetical protein
VRTHLQGLALLALVRVLGQVLLQGGRRAGGDTAPAAKGVGPQRMGQAARRAAGGRGGARGAARPRTTSSLICATRLGTTNFSPSCTRARAQQATERGGEERGGGEPARARARARKGATNGARRTHLRAQRHGLLNVSLRRFRHLD